MIMATKIPHSPRNLLEQIVCDADLDYLGRDDFKKISNTLFEEMKTYAYVHSEKEWYNIQRKFLESHTYYTEFGKKNREAGKQRHLKEICRVISKQG
jgi:hypothetical protein